MKKKEFLSWWGHKKIEYGINAIFKNLQYSKGKLIFTVLNIYFTKIYFYNYKSYNYEL